MAAVRRETELKVIGSSREEKKTKWKKRLVAGMLPKHRSRCLLTFKDAEESVGNLRSGSGSIKKGLQEFEDSAATYRTCKKRYILINYYRIPQLFVKYWKCAKILKLLEDSPIQ